MLEVSMIDGQAWWCYPAEKKHETPLYGFIPEAGT
jgi:hypothetical protein